MRKILSPKFLWMFIACAFALASTRAAEPFQAAAPAADQQPTACGAQTYCYDTPHFAATVTSFRTSTVNGYKLIDTSIRFLNKTGQPLILGYVTASGFATDDRGNRSAVGGPNGYRGIGLVVGNNFDPKMIVRPGGSGEAQFELVLQGFPQIVGFHYVLDLTVAEIKTLEGNQHMLDGEFPLHFEGLANGVSQGAGSFAGAPDGLANAVSSLKSIFGKKKAVQNVATAANSAASTAAAMNAAANSAASQSPSATANTLGQAGSSAKAASQQLASAQPAAGTPNGQTAGAAEPWTPPADGAAKAADLVDPLKLPEVAKMPDVVGVRLGMTEQQALQILHGQYPRGRFQEIPASGIFPTNPKADYGFNVLPTDAIATDVVVSLTAPPGPQVVWRIVRYTRRIHSSHANVLVALRQKYGKESLAGQSNGTIATDEQSIGQLLWVFDEHGGRPPMPSPQAFGSSSMTGIPCGAMVGSGGPLSDVGPRIPMEEIKSQDWCSSVVGMVVTIDPTEIVENTITNMVDMKLAARTANAFVAWQRDAAARARAAELEKSKKNKPVF